MTRFAYILASLLFLSLVGAKYDPHTGFTKLIRFGSLWSDFRLPEVKSSGPLALESPTSSGYDGQFYAQIAVDPLLRNPALATALDVPTYRARRILVPVTAFLIGGGVPWWVLQAYALVNVICWVVLAWLMRSWIGGTGWPEFARWAGCLFSMGALESVRQSLVDLPALLLLALSICAATQSQTNRQIIWSALGNLAKETTSLGLVAIEATCLLRPGKRFPALVRVFLTLAPLGLWCFYVNQRLPTNSSGHGLGNFSWPFIGLISEAKICLDALIGGNFDSRFSFGLVAIVGLLAQAAALWSQRDVESPWWRVGAAYALLLPFLSLWVWSGYWAACRALLPLTIAFNLLLRPNRAFWPLWTLGNLTLLHAVWRFV